MKELFELFSPSGASATVIALAILYKVYEVLKKDHREGHTYNTSTQFYKDMLQVARERQEENNQLRKELNQALSKINHLERKVNDLQMKMTIHKL